ncbi:MAG: hypothetical protein DA407_04805 [Bacteroidetes bacterium]|nr:MAG: hypothetical protein DA407_04805 [Bacteroidota bacterium]
MFNQRKHKRFNYKPRHTKSDETMSSSDKASQNDVLSSKWQSVRETTKRKGKRGFSLPVLFLILVLLLICMYVLEIKFMSN